MLGLVPLASCDYPMPPPKPANTESSSSPGLYPRRPSLHVSRKRLQALLLGRQVRLRLICAPAGFGKTQLLADCAREARGVRVAWVDLDGRPLDPAGLFARIGQALGVEGGAWDETRLVECLQRQSEPLWLMLDDFPRQPDAQLDACLGRLLALRLPAVQWWLGTRRRPACNLAALLLQDELLELGAAALAFDDMELEVLQAQAGMPAEAQALRGETSGWCAAVGFALIARRQPRANGLLEEYLQYELIEALAVEDLESLSALACLPRFDLGLCECLFGIASGTARLRRLRALDAFVEPLEEGDGWFRILPPVARLLVARQPEERVRDLHRQACGWFVERGDIRQAIEQALSAGMAETAARLLERLSEQELINEQSGTRFLAYCASLPEHLLESTPRLVILHALVCALCCRNDEGKAGLEKLARFLPAATGESQAALLGSWLGLRGIFAHADGDTPLARECCRQALATLGSGEALLRMVCWSVLTQQSLFRGDLSAAQALLDQAESIGSGLGPQAVQGFVAAYQPLLLEARGDLAAARQLVERHLQRVAGQRPERLAIGGRLLLRRGYLDYRMGDRVAARQAFDEGLRLSCLSADPVGFHGLVGKARLALLDDQSEVASDLLVQAEEWCRQCGVPAFLYRSVIDLSRAALLIRNAEPRPARVLLDRLIASHQGEDGICQPFEKPEMLHEARLLRARADLLEGDFASARMAMQELLGEADEKGLRLSVAETRLGLAELAFLQGDETEARSTLAHARGLCEGLSLRAPLESLQARQPQLFRLAPGSGRPGLLSEREIEVLRLIEAGYSNQEIGEKLFISIFTVKSHLQRLGSKLGVRRRTQAVSRAKALGLL